ncbi:hypothetical protein [uncultured Ruegeria sp.]|uniref:hypothetical protein n=1 Tax=uncultured Ruegeria sp. TaxID=259304 RepID=UPI002608C762|nr:hypothetical protein [uncultured Ruegeria sp.]
MKMSQPETWQRHQLASAERMQADIARFTRPVMNITTVFSLIYLVTWGPLFALGTVDSMPLISLLTAALSGCVIALSMPAFALAIGIESYFARRLRALQIASPQI